MQFGKDPDNYEAKVALSHDTNAVYFKFSDRSVSTTKNILGPKCLILVDYDAEGNAIGLELFGGAELYNCINKDVKND